MARDILKQSSIKPISPPLHAGRKLPVACYAAGPIRVALQEPYEASTLATMRETPLQGGLRVSINWHEGMAILWDIILNGEVTSPRLIDIEAPAARLSLRDDWFPRKYSCGFFI